MSIITNKYFKLYQSQLSIDLRKAMKTLETMELTPKNFTFYTSVAVISSSKIEGEQMELDSYLKYKIQNIEYLPELVEKPNDLFNAYLFAKDHNLTKDNFLHCHILLSTHLLPAKYRGSYRKNEMLVMEHRTGRIQYEAAPFAIVEAEMISLWEDIEQLISNTQSIEEIFYYASFIHLAFVNNHPFNDGNGRAARLLEKWFLVQKLGEAAWYIPSEKYYYHHVESYYKNLNRLGLLYEKLDYQKADAFLQMLPSAINYNKQ